MEKKLLLECIAGVTLIFALAVFAAWTMRKHTAASRHMVWWLASLASLLLPVASFWKPASAPSIHLVPVQTTVVDVTFVNVTGAANQPSAWTWIEGLTAVWLAGVCLLSVRLVLAHVRISLRRRASISTEIVNGDLGIPVRLSDRISVPETFGFWKPVILLPIEAQTWPGERLEVVLAHELVHIARRDCLTQLIAQVAACVYWFHPLVWLALSQMRKERELACDDGVLRLGYRNSEYAQHLVEIASGVSTHSDALSPSVAMATRSQLETRVRAILNPRLNRGKVTTMMKIAAISCATIAVFVFSGDSTAATGSRISGTVSDISGGVIPEATVVLTRITPPRSTVATTSDNAGDWSFATVEAGEYNLEVKTPGFRAYQQRVTVTAGTPMSFGIRLDVGSIQENITVQGETSAPLPRGSATPRRVRVGGNVRPPTLTTRVAPEYPQHLKDAGISGTVILQAVISSEGEILNVRSISPDANQSLVDAAINAVKQWKYAPTLLNGVAVEVVTMINVNFALSHKG